MSEKEERERREKEQLQKAIFDDKSKTGRNLLMKERPPRKLGEVLFSLDRNLLTIKVFIT